MYDEEGASSCCVSCYFTYRLSACVCMYGGVWCWRQQSTNTTASSYMYLLYTVYTLMIIQIHTVCWILMREERSWHSGTTYIYTVYYNTLVGCSSYIIAFLMFFVLLLFIVHRILQKQQQLVVYILYRTVFVFTY